MTKTIPEGVGSNRTNVLKENLKNWIHTPLGELFDPGFIELSWVPLSQIRSQPGYQRDIKIHRVKRYAENFDIRLFGAVVLARYPNGLLGEGPLDGMHRVETLAYRFPGQEIMVPCFIIPVKDSKEEAAIFETLNRERVRLEISEIFRSRLYRDESRALAIVETVKKAGWDMAPAEKGVAWNVLVRPGAAEFLYTQSPAHLVSVLEFLNRTWPTQIKAKSDQVLLGVGHLLNYYESQKGWDDVKISQTLGNIALITILRGVKTTPSGSHSRRAEATGDTFATVYNENRNQGAVKLNVPVRGEKE